MGEVAIIATDLAKRSFQVHGARPDRSVAYRRKLGRGKLLSVLSSRPKCKVAVEACAGAATPVGNCRGNAVSPTGRRPGSGTQPPIQVARRFSPGVAGGRV